MCRLLCFALVLLVVFTGMLSAQIPRTMSYQALLTSSSGDPLPDGLYDLTFSLYTTAEGGTAVWSESHEDVDVSGGTASAVLGSQLPLNISFDRPYFLGIEVGDAGELKPRTPLTAAPYSLSDADGAGFWTPAEGGITYGGGAVGIGTASPAAILDLGGPGRNIRLGHYGHIGETLSGAALVIGDNVKVDSLVNNRVNFASSNDDGASAIEMFYLNGISFFTKPAGELNTAGEQFFRHDDRTYERMRITGDGRVAIGTMSPSQFGQMHVNSSSRKFAIFGSSLNGINGTGVRGEGQAVGVEGVSYGGSGYGGYFVGARGVYAMGADNDAPDIVLGSSGTDDDGRIFSNPFFSGSDIWIHSNDDVVLVLDANNDEFGVFDIQDHTGAHVFRVYDDGRVYVHSTLTHGSDRERKHDVVPVDPAEILEQVGNLPISRWVFNGEQATHLGPMAQDFKVAFGLGDDERSIATVDADGVALAAIQGLYEMVQKLQAENQELRAMIEAMDR